MNYCMFTYRQDRDDGLQQEDVPRGRREVGRVAAVHLRDARRGHQLRGLLLQSMLKTRVSIVFLLKLARARTH